MWSFLAFRQLSPSSGQPGSYQLASRVSTDKRPSRRLRADSRTVHRVADPSGVRKSRDLASELTCAVDILSFVCPRAATQPLATHSLHSLYLSLAKYPRLRYSLVKV